VGDISYWRFFERNSRLAFVGADRLFLRNVDIVTLSVALCAALYTGIVALINKYVPDNRERKASVPRAT